MEARPFSTRPLYLQVRDFVAEHIAKGQWKPGTAIPNEGDLAREFGVSPGTVRKALDLLEGERLVTRRQGRGTFVNDQCSKELANRFINIRGPNGDRIVGADNSGGIANGVANEMERMRLCLLAGERVSRMHRVRFANGKPFMVVEACVPSSLFPSIEQVEGDPGRIVSLAQRYGILLGKAEERISIATVSRDVAEALGVPRGSPIAALDRVVRDNHGRPVEWRMAWCDLAENYYLALMD